jgi:hypothetical protein
MGWEGNEVGCECEYCGNQGEKSCPFAQTVAELRAEIEKLKQEALDLKQEAVVGKLNLGLLHKEGA